MPGRGTDVIGRTWTGKYRVRNRFLFGAVLEELVTWPDGSAEWIRKHLPVPIAFNDPALGAPLPLAYE